MAGWQKCSACGRRKPPECYCRGAQAVQTMRPQRTPPASRKRLPSFRPRRTPGRTRSGYPRNCCAAARTVGACADRPALMPAALIDSPEHLPQICGTSAKAIEIARGNLMNARLASSRWPAIRAIRISLPHGRLICLNGFRLAVRAIRIKLQF
jgi:hypothetical protein